MLKRKSKLKFLIVLTMLITYIFVGKTNIQAQTNTVSRYIYKVYNEEELLDALNNSPYEQYDIELQNDITVNTGLTINKSINIYTLNNSKFTISMNSESNFFGSYQTFVKILNNADVSIENISFVGNSSKESGKILRGFLLNPGNVTMKNCSISNLFGNESAGAILGVNKSSIHLIDCNIHDVEVAATSRGAAIAAEDSTVLMEGGTISNTVSTKWSWGGIITGGDSVDGEVTLKNVNLINNRHTNFHSLFFHLTKVNVENCNFFNNQSTTSIFYMTRHTTIKNCNFKGNITYGSDKTLSINGRGTEDTIYLEGNNTHKDAADNDVPMIIDANIAVGEKMNSKLKVLVSNYYSIKAYNGYKFTIDDLNIFQIGKEGYSFYINSEDNTICITTKKIITLDANDGSSKQTTRDVPDGFEAPLPLDSFYREGYTIIGWNTKPDGDGIAYTTNIIATQDLVLYAQWKKVYEDPSNGIENYTYDGTIKKYKIDSQFNGYKIFYQKDGNIIENPIDSGNYDVILTKEGNDTYVDFKKVIEKGLVIEKANIDVNKTNQTYVYDGNNHGEDVKIKTVNHEIPTIVYGEKEGVYDLKNSPKKKDAGTYTIYYKVTAPNYNSVEGAYTILINKAKCILTVKDVTIKLGENPIFDYKLSVNNVSLKILPTYSCDYNNKTGIFDITAQDAILDNDNYEIEYVSGKLRVYEKGFTDRKDIPVTPNKVNDITNSKEVNDEKNHYDVSIVNGDELETILEITSLEKEQGVNVWLRVKDDTTSLNDMNKKLILEKATDCTIGSLMDCSLYKKVGDNLLIKINKLNKNLKISVIIPENIRKENRKYSVVRIHEGIATLLEGEYDKERYTLTFETDRFSSYAIVYKDQNSNSSLNEVLSPVKTMFEKEKDISLKESKETLKKNTTKNQVKTADDTSSNLFILMLIISGFGIILFINKIKYRKHNL